MSIAWLVTLQFAGVNALFALSIYVSLWTGVLSLAPVVFGAVSGFTFGFLCGTHGLPPVLGLLIGLVAGVLMGGITAVLVIRLETHYLAMATIAMVLICQVFVLNLPSVTGGASGLVVPGDLGTWAWLIGTLVVSALVLWRLSGSRWGLAADAVREDPAVAQTLAISPRRIQLIGFLLSGALGGLAGVFESSFLQYIGPGTFYTAIGFTALAAVVLGGAYHWAGPIVGAVVFTLLPEMLRSPLGDYNQLVTGVLLLVIILFAPRGLVDRRWTRALAGIRGRPRPRREGTPATDAEPAPMTGAGVRS